MKNLEYYMSLPYRMEVVPDIEEGGYMASFPELPGCLTCADTMEELIVNAQDANSVIQYLMNSGKISQDQYNRAYQQYRNMVSNNNSR